MFSKKCFSFHATLYFHVQLGDLRLTAFEIYSKIAEMAKESVHAQQKVFTPALVNCVAPVEIILPQIIFQHVVSGS